MAHTCVSSSTLRLNSSSFSLSATNPFSSPSSSTKNTSLPFQPLRSRKLTKSSVNAMYYPEKSARRGIWSIRDDLQVPSSPFLPTCAQGVPMGQERYTSIINQLFHYRIIRCGGEVEDDMANTIVAQLMYLDAVDPTKDIIMYVNSPGGSVTAGMAIYDTMMHIRPDVSTVCVGIAASMGAFLLSAGTKGKRYCLPNARMMIHQPYGGIQGAASEVKIQVDEILHHKATLTSYLAYYTGQTYHKVDEDTERDFFMNAQEAKEYGLIDDVIFNPLKTVNQFAVAAEHQ